MIDKLKLSTHLKVNQYYVEFLIQTGELKPVSDDFYQYKFSYDLHGLSIGVTNFYHRTNCIELNPSKIESFSKLLEIISPFFIDFDPEQFILQRIDFAVDIQENIVDVFEWIRVARSKKFQVIYNGTIPQTIYFSKKPDILAVYNDSTKHTANETRIERRLFNNKIPKDLRKLSDLPKFQDFEVFRKIQKVTINSNTPKTVSKILIYEGIKSLIKNKGLSITKKITSKDGNGKRYEQFFSNPTKVFEIEALSRKALFRFFNADIS